MTGKIKTPVLISSAEPFFFSGNEVGCLLVHGFTDSPKEMRPLGEYLNEQGYSVLGIRITGHATNINNLRRTRWKDLVASVEDGYHLLKNNTRIRKIFIIGHSMGGALTLFTSSYLPFDGVVALAAPYQISKEGLLNEYMMAFKMHTDSLKRKLKSRKLKERLPGWYWYQPELSRGYIKYNQKPFICNLQLLRVANQVKYALPKINSPVLLMHSHKDTIVQPNDMEMIFEGLASRKKEMVWLEKSSHMLPVDGERETVFQQIGEFIKGNL
jgi:carboxylesterase